MPAAARAMRARAQPLRRATKARRSPPADTVLKSGLKLSVPSMGGIAGGAAIAGASPSLARCCRPQGGVEAVVMFAPVSCGDLHGQLLHHPLHLIWTTDRNYIPVSHRQSPQSVPGAVSQTVGSPALSRLQTPHLACSLRSWPLIDSPQPPLRPMACRMR
jgi:hypothetical protein